MIIRVCFTPALNITTHEKHTTEQTCFANVHVGYKYCPGFRCLFTSSFSPVTRAVIFQMETKCVNEVTVSSKLYTGYLYLFYLFILMVITEMCERLIICIVYMITKVTH